MCFLRKVADGWNVVFPFEKVTIWAPDRDAAIRMVASVVLAKSGWA